MEKIKLSKEEKRILMLLKEKKFKVSASHTPYLTALEQLELITGSKAGDDNYFNAILTDFGKTYLLKNPKLKNPNIFDDKKFWITTGIALLALIVSAFALFISINKN